ncbi:Uncharacterised protein [Candidatus Gugararchaeum adminiculabundum]|nr:Uncharacterised protein [Candidatus Gugararchaeum adminiculabundum]
MGDFTRLDISLPKEIDGQPVERGEVAAAVVTLMRQSIPIAHKETELDEGGFACWFRVIMKGVDEFWINVSNFTTDESIEVSLASNHIYYAEEVAPDQTAKIALVEEVKKFLSEDKIVAHLQKKRAEKSDFRLEVPKETGEKTVTAKELGKIIAALLKQRSNEQIELSEVLPGTLMPKYDTAVCTFETKIPGITEFEIKIENTDEQKPVLISLNCVRDGKKTSDLVARMALVKMLKEILTLPAIQAQFLKPANSQAVDKKAPIKTQN